MDPHLLKTLTYISSALSLIVALVLVILLIRHKPKKTYNLFLAVWLSFSAFLVPLFGSLIMASDNPKTALCLYQLLASASGLFFGFFYLFVQDFIGTESKKQLRVPIISYAAFTLALALIKPDILVVGVDWSEAVEFYLFKVNPVGLVFVTPLILLYALGIYKLFMHYRKCRSVIEKNRLKYLLLGTLAPFIGFALIVTPPFRSYPFDILGITVSGILLSYGILKYRLMDISLIIRKGLLYSLLTMVVTGVYLGLSFLIQFLLHGTEAPLSLPTLISTALIVALVFQPLQMNTQRVIDRVFFRRKYDPQKLVANLTEIFSKNLDLNFLSSELVDQICQTMQIEKAVFFLADENTAKFRVQKQRNMINLPLNLAIAKDSPFTDFLLKSREPQLKESLKAKNISLGDLDNLDLELFIPLKSKDQLLGILALGSKLSSDYYSLEEFGLLNTVAKSATLALENAFLFSQIQESKTVLEIKVRAKTKELEELTKTLDEQVKQRTIELQQKINELERFYKVAVGRELKMVELKKKINDLSKEQKND